MKLKWTVGGPLAILFAGATLAEEPTRNSNAYLFAGRILSEDFGDSLKIVGTSYEDNYVTAAGYQHLAYEGEFARVGYEVGAGLRYGDDFSAEGWAGLVGRIDDIRLLEGLYVAPSIVFGLSVVSSAQRGRETRREEETGGDATMLFYLGPELEFRTSKESRYGFFYRLHHRSGAWRTLGDMEGATNASVFGLRFWF